MYCRAQLGELSDRYEELQDLSAEVLAISTDDLHGAETIAQRVGIQFPVLYDPDAEVVKAYGVYNKFNDRLAAPSTFIVDKQGVIQWKYVAGDAYYDIPSTEQVLDQLRAMGG